LKIISIESLKNIEHAFYTIERELVDNNKTTSHLLYDCREKFREVSSQKSELLEEIQQIPELREQLNNARQKFREVSSQKSELLEKVQQIPELKNKLHKLENELKHYKTKYKKTYESFKGCKESLSYRLGHILIHEKKALINPVPLFRKIKTLKKVLNEKRVSHKKKISTQINNHPQLSQTKTQQIRTQAVLKQDNAEIYLSTLGWEEKIDKNKPIVMAVFDEFTHTCFQYQYNLIEPRPDNWKGLLDQYPPEFLFIESTWKGNYGSWQYRVAQYAHPPGNELHELVEECKKRNIPTIFWNKEDPIHFNNFKQVAKWFDFIFTSALEAIPNYKKITKAKVEVLQFAAEEHLHNPMHTTSRKNAVCFAGSYYTNRFTERRDDQLMLLRAAKEYNLEVFDRNYSPDKSVRSDFEFPKEFDSFVIGSLPYAQLVKRYKDYKVFLNVNSIIDSKTMFSRRIFELLACGTPIISTQALGIEETFGKDIVWTVKNETEAKKAFETLMNNPKEWRKRSLKGIRSVFNHHTYTHRAKQINDTLFGRKVNNDKKCLLLSIIDTKKELLRIEKICKSQDTSNTKLLYYVITNNIVLKDEKSENIKIIYSEGNIEKEIENIITIEEANYFILMSSSSVYGKHFINDAIIALEYSHALFSAKVKSIQDIYDYSQDIFTDSIVCNYRNLQKTKYSLKDTLRFILSNKNSFRNEDIYCADAANFHHSDTLLSEDEYTKKIQNIEV